MPNLRVTLLALLTAGYVVAVYVFFRPVRLRIWNDFGAIDVFVMASLILPFMVTPRLARPRLRVTRYAWGISAVMALDLVFFALGELGPLGSGHPSLESLASYFLALAKVVLVPVVLVLLGVASVKGEHMGVVAIGFLCLAGETLYATYPLEWWSTV